MFGAKIQVHRFLSPLFSTSRRVACLVGRREQEGKLQVLLSFLRFTFSRARIAVGSIGTAGNQEIKDNISL